MHQTPNLKCVRGNHDLYFINGLPEPQPKWMSDGELRHQLWTNKQLGEHRKSIISEWPMTLEFVIDGLNTTFLHYGLTSLRNDFVSIVHNPGSSDLDDMFDQQLGHIIFYGHDHASSDVQGNARYINPGSLGCSPKAVTRYTIARYEDGQIDIKHHSVAYDNRPLFKAFEDRDVPEREFIYKAFYGGRFGT